MGLPGPPQFDCSISVRHGLSSASSRGRTKLALGPSVTRLSPTWLDKWLRNLRNYSNQGQLEVITASNQQESARRFLAASSSSRKSVASLVSTDQARELAISGGSQRYLFERRARGSFDDLQRRWEQVQACGQSGIRTRNSFYPKGAYPS